MTVRDLPFNLGMMGLGLRIGPFSIAGVSEEIGVFVSTVDGQSVASGIVTTNTKPTLTGYARVAGSDAGLVIHFFLPNGTEDGTATSDASGNWSYTYQNDLPAGTYDLFDLITSEIPVGNEATDSIVVDDAITFIGAATGTAGATLPAHQAGDLIIAAVFRDGGTFTVPAGWTQIVSNGQSSYSAVLYYKIAASNAETVTGFTNATDVIAAVYRGVHQASPIGGTSAVSGASGTITRATFTPTIVDGSSWMGTFMVCRNTTQSPNYSGNYTQRGTHENATATSEAWFADTNAGVSTVPTANIVTAGQNCSILSFEIKSHG
ncbi:hypothetical protein EVC03_065 [Rhizobium phage RHph_Y5A]|nr:hypothetical protein EVC03_065 [Rhizobium phage RHph_Y5A]QIG75507.1 hypothetical protein EVC18_065 [Rhizobium phage RHph_Y2_4]